MNEFFAWNDEKVWFDGARVKVTKRTFSSPDGEDFVREIVRVNDAVAVVPVQFVGGQWQAFALNQYRAPVDKPIIEICAGLIDEGETPAEAAARELREEMGLVADSLVFLASFYTSPGISDENITVFAALRCTQVDAAPDGVEERFTEIRQLPLKNVERLASRGVLQDAKTILGLALTKSYLSENPWEVG